MLADWYFCSAINTPPASAQAFLDLLDVLDSPHSPSDLLLVAVDELARCEPWMRVYATSRLLAAVRRCRDITRSAQLGMVELSESLPTAAARPFRDAVSAVLGHRPAQTQEKALIELARTCRGTAQVPPTVQPYLDLPEFTLQALALSLLLEFVERGGSLRALLEADDESACTQVLSAAEDGRYGRLPLLLAVRLAGASGSGRRPDHLMDVLACCENSVPWLEPDLLATAAWLSFEMTPATDAGPIETEAVTADLLHGLRGRTPQGRGAREAAVLALLGHIDEPAATWSTVLWQATLWAAAARVHPVDTADRLGRWWRAPGADDQPIGNPGGPVADLRPWTDYLTGLLQLRQTDPPQLFTVPSRHLAFTPDQAAALFSPWLSRQHDYPRTSRSTDTYRRDTGAAALRLLASVPIAVGLLRQREVVAREHLLDLVVHAKDVLTTSRLSEAASRENPSQADGAGSTLPPALVVLGRWVFYLVERAGRGTLREIAPHEFVDLLTQRRSRSRDPRQRRLLHDRASGLLMASWLKEVMAAIAGPAEPDPEARWLAGSNSPAERLLTGVLQRVAVRGGRYRPIDTSNAAALAHLRLPGVAVATNHWDWRDIPDPPWQYYLLGGIQKLSDGDLAFDRCEHHSNRLKRLAGLTECVAALLVHDTAEHEPRVELWVDAWLSAIVELNEPVNFPQHVQARFVQLLELFEISGHDRQRLVLEHAVHAVVEFSLNKPAELTRVFAALGRDSAQARSPELRAVLRSHFLDVIYQRQRRVGHRKRGAARSPWLVTRTDSTSALLDRSLRILLLRLGDEGAVQDQHGPRQVAREGWHRQVLSPTIRTSSVEPSGRLAAQPAAALVGITVDPARDELRLHQRAAPNLDGAVDLFEATPADRERFRSDLARRGRETLGVICACDEPGIGVWVNCGLGVPIPVPDGYSRRLRRGEAPASIGSVVRVPLRYNPTVAAGCEVADYVDPLGRDADAKESEVRSALVERLDVGDHYELRVWVGEEEIELTADRKLWTADTLDRWLPDLSKRLDDDRKGSWTTPVERVGKRWLPVDRSLTELIADGIDDGLAAGVVVLVSRTDGGWRLATRPGENYVVDDGDWHADDAAKLLAEVGRLDGKPTGLLVAVGLATDDDGAVRLGLLPAPPPRAHDHWPNLVADRPFDDRNVRWREAGTHEVLFAGADPDGWWHDPGIPGFPRIKIEGLPAGRPGDYLPVEPGQWDWRERRTATLRASQQEDRRLDVVPSARRAFVDQMHQLAPGAQLSLDVAFALKEGFDCRVALTREQLRVHVTAESVDPLETQSGVQRFAADRRAEVVGLYSTRPRWAPLDLYQPVTDETLLATVVAADRAEMAQALSAGELRGVVAGSPKSEGSAVQNYTLWLELGDHITELPAIAHSTGKWPVPIGSPVLACFADGCWNFTAEARTKIIVRALWRVTETQKRRFGSMRVSVGGTEQQARPDPREGTLALREDRSAQQPQATRTVEVSSRSSAPIVLGGNGARDRAYRVVVDDGATRRTGQTRHRGVTGQLRLHDERWILDDVGAGYYTLAREFEFARPAVGEPGDVQEERRREALAEYLARPVPVPAIRGELGFALDGLEVPTGSGWTTRVGAAESDPAWVEGNEYDRDNATVVVRETLDGFVASCRDVPPLNLERLAAQLGVVAGQQRSRQVERMYYAGPVAGREPDSPAVRFEWGFGHTLVVPLDRILVDHEPISAIDELPMFFGDHITRIDLRRAPDARYLLLNLRRADVWPSDETELSEQAKARIIVLIAVTIDPRTESVRIDHALSRPKKLSRLPGRTALADALSTYRTRRAELDDDSRREVLNLYRGSGGSTTLRTHVLAVLDHKEYENSRGRRVVFQYRRLSADPSVPYRLTEGDLLFVSGGKLRTGHNDVQLVFPLTAGIKVADWSRAGDLGELVVTRRRYAVREAVLRRHASRGENALRQRTFLVRLVEPRTARRDERSGASWNGEITNPPARGVRSLVGLLRAVDTPVFATVAQVSAEEHVFEVDAGVEIVVPRHRLKAEHVERGAVVRLDVNADGRVSVIPAVRGDRAFAVDGRPAVVFPIDTLSSVRNPDTVTIPCLVVAGLPDVQARPGGASRSRGDGPALRRVMARPHPKVVALKVGGAGIGADVLPANRSAVLVDVDEDDLTVQLREAQGDQRWPAEIAGLSFADESARRVLARLRATTWYYTDSRTRTWPGGDPAEMLSTDVIGPADPTVQPLFCNQRGTLRHTPAELRGLAYPTGELLDWAVAAHQEDIDGVVAGVVEESDCATGLWIERAPGRVVEVLGNLMVLREGSGIRLTRPVPMSNVYWGGFAPGDRLTLRLIDKESNHPALEFGTWQPGPRGGFAGRRAALRVVDADRVDGALCVGAGDWTSTHPLPPAQVDAHPIGSIVWLTPDSTLHRLDAAAPIQAGDVALLVVDGTTLRVDGLPGHVDVEADQEGWPGSAWLADALRDPARAVAVMQIVGGALPVTIEATGPGTLRISRRHQPPGTLPPGTTAPTAVLGLSAELILLRCGSALLAAPVDDLIPGLPTELRPDLAAALADRATTLWVHSDSGGRLRCGLPTTADDAAPRDIRVRPEIVVGTGAEAGVLCRRAENLGLAWLPGSAAGWVRLDREQMVAHLVEPGWQCTARLQADGRLSLVEAAAAQERFDALTVGDTLRVLVIGPARLTTVPNRYRYLARAYLTDVLLEFESADAGHLVSTDPLQAEVAKRRTAPAPTLVAVGSGERLVRIDLPRWMLETNPDRAGVIEQFRPYEQAYQTGIAEPSADLDELSLQLLRAAGAAGPDQRPVLDVDRALLAWFEQHGDDAFGLRGDHALDLYPFLVAVLELAARYVAEPASASASARASVELARQLGLRAVRARHLEPILDDWLLALPNRPRTRWWKRLDSLPLPHTLSPQEVGQFVERASSLAVRSRSVDDPALRRVSLGLLAAVGRLDRYDELAEYDGYLNQLVELGHGLRDTPGDIAQQHLLDSQVLLLRDVLQELRDDHGVMTLLPPLLETSAIAGRNLLTDLLDELRAALSESTPESRRSPDEPAPVLPDVFELTEATDPGDLAHALRQRNDLTVSFARLPSPLVSAYAAYLLGLAASVPAGQAEWPEPQRMIVRRPHPPVFPPTTSNDPPERYLVRTFDGSVDMLARRIRLGQALQVDLREAEPQVAGAVRMFLAGVCADLPVNIDSTDGGHILAVYRR